MKRLFAVLFVFALGAQMFVCVPKADARFLGVTDVFVTSELVDGLIYKERDTKKTYGITCRVGMAKTVNGPIELRVGEGDKILPKYDPQYLPWAHQLVFVFEVRDDEGNLVDPNPKVSLAETSLAGDSLAGKWAACDNRLSIDTSTLVAGEYSVTFRRSSQGRKERRILMFFRDVKKYRVSNVCTSSFTLYEAAARIERYPGVLAEDAAERQQSYRAAVMCLLQAYSPNAILLNEPNLPYGVEEGERAKLEAKRLASEQVAQQNAAEEARRQAEEAQRQQAAQAAQVVPPFTVTVECLVRDWKTDQLRLVITGPDGKILYYDGGCVTPITRNLAAGTYRYQISRGGVPILGRDFTVGPGKPGLLVRLKGGQ